MTKQDKLDKLREVIVEANPSIKDLVFGCEVKCINGVVFRLTEKGEVTNVDKNRHNVLTIYIGEKWRSVEMTITEIIGRPIRLADVLLAIQFHEVSYSPDQLLNLILLGLYNLKDDNLDNQSKETIDFLYELLVK